MWTWLHEQVNVNSPWYGFWSGPGGVLLTILTGVCMWLRRHHCHVRRCFRLGRCPVDGTTYVVCRKHHPDDAPSASDVQQMAAAQQ